MTGTIKTSTHNVWIEVDRETGKYYRWLYQKYSGIKLQRPSNGDHITVTMNLPISEMPAIKNLDGWAVEFNTILSPKTNGNAIWYPVSCCYAEAFRELYSMYCKDLTPLHYCIGYLGENLEKRN